VSYDNPPPPPQYGAPVPGATPENSGKATASMITGLVGLLTICCGLFVVSSIVAIVLGVMARREIAASGGRLQGESRATTGIVTGVIGIALLVVSIILVATGVIDTNFDYSTDVG
jgi:hypothetical protein